MKKIYFLLIALGFFVTTNAQYTAIPDANFEAELIYYGLDSGPIDHKVLTANISTRTSLNVHGGNISDLTGIQDFVALKSLDCSSNQLTSLNLSRLTALTYLNCGVNQLTSLNLSGFSVLTYLDCGRNKLTSLNLSGCKTLKDMFCTGNPLLLCIQVDNIATPLNNNYWKDEIATYSVNCALITAIPDENFEAVLIARGYDRGPIDHKVFTTNINEITNLDVSGEIISNLSGIQDFVALQTLFCNNNQLTSLNVSGLTSLKQLNCEANKLTSLNVSGLSSLISLSCSANQLTSLNVSGLTGLTNLSCSANQLTSLNVSGLTNLKTLYCDSNQLTSLNIIGLSALKLLNCSSNQLSSMNLSGLSDLTLLNCSTNYLSSINLNGLIGLTNLSCGNNQLASLDISGLLYLKDLSCNSNQLTNLELRELKTLASMNCTANPTLLCIVVENTAVAMANSNWYKDTTATYSLNCDSRYTTIPDVRFEQGLIDLGYDSGPIDHRVLTANINTITSLDLSYGSGNVIYDSTGIQDFVALQRLVINNSQLSSLDVSGLEALTYLNCSTNQLKSLNVSGCKALNYLDCSVNKISSLNLSDCIALSDLKCQGNQLMSLNVSECKALKTLNCVYNQLTSLNVNGLLALNYLDCNGNKLTSLNVNGCTALTDLICPFNQLTSLDVSGLKSLTTLTCSNNQLTSLNLSECKALITLDCGLNKISSLNVSDCVALNLLHCSTNNLSSLNLNELIGLTNLSCGSNQLTSLDISELKALTYLLCSLNQLTSLNVSGCKYLNYLYCNGNQLASLNVNGISSLTYLDCSGNQLTSLNVSDLTNLKTLLCYKNQLTSLNLNGLIALSTIRFESNQLASLFMKNGKKDLFSISGNPNLKYVCADEVELIKIQNDLARYGYNNCTVNSYCSFTLGGTFYTIQGNNKVDSNNNGCDVLDKIFPNQKFTISNDTTTGSFIADTSGNYSIPVQAGTHTIAPIIENPTYFNVSPTAVTITFPTQTSPFVQKFCITPNGNHPDLEITLLPLQPASPGFDAKYKIVYKNKGNATQSGSVNLVFDDTVLDLVLANPVTTTQTTNNLSWNFTNLLPFETREITFTLNVNSPMETPAVNSGYVLANKATIISAATDETPNDNAFIFNQTVVNSFDPNDKTCLEGTTISPSLIGQYVHYMIRFENNGTANAQNIVVKDLIDLLKFDISTLIPTNASHSFVTNISNGNKVEFIFENINLPFDDPNNDGYIAFKIKTKPTLVVNDTFINDASIFFDYNFPIITNKATSTFKTLATQDFEFSNYFTLYPNPVKSVLNISSKETIEMQSISIYNTLGQLVLVVPNAEKISKIDVSNLTTGNYFIKINSDKGTSNTRFIKE